MMVVPGSHKEPMLDHHQDGVFVGAVSPARDGLDLEAAVPLEMTAGSLAAHHARTLLWFGAESFGSVAPAIALSIRSGRRLAAGRGRRLGCF